MALKVLIPTVSETPDPSVETRGVYVEEWIEGLPYADFGVVVRNVLEAVTKLNRSPVKAATRLSLMELYAQPYQYLMELQEKHSGSRTVAAFERHRADTEAARRVATEMAYGYKLVLAHSLGKKTLFGKSKDVAIALQRALLFVSFSLMHSYDEYMPAPRLLWSELWELFNYATASQLETQPTTAKNLRGEFQTTVAHAYKRILLTSVIDPYHLAEGEIWKVFSLLGDWTDAAELTAMTEVDKPTGYFVLDPHSDQRPISYAEAMERDIGEGCRLLNTNPVIQLLQQSLKGAGGPTPERNLLGRMVRSLGLPPKRHSPRTSTGGQVNLTSGISTLHHFIGGANGEIPALEPQQIVPDDDGIEIGDTPTGNTESSGPAYNAEHWDLVDRGPGGIGLLRQSRPNVPIGVGELIGVLFADQAMEDTWSVGVVRWLNIAEVGEYHAGVQILSGQAQAVSVNAEHSTSSGRAALALPKVGADKGSTLLTPKGFYTKGSTLLVGTPANTFKVRAGALVGTSDVYDRFNYEVV